jgi:hypothetical protein
MIIIAGDSWATGEIGLDCNRTHGGLAQYLVENKHEVINIGEGGSSNNSVISKLEIVLPASLAFNKKIDKIFVFQTEWDRDFNAELTRGINFFEFYNDRHSRLFKRLGYHYDDSVDFFKVVNISTPRDIEHRLISHFYGRLSELSQYYNVPIWLIGGCTDILHAQMQETYPGLNVACQSMHSLLMYNNSEITDDVVLSFYDNQHIQKWMKTQFSNNLDELIYLYNLGLRRQEQWKNNRELFWPDGNHANRKGHRILYEFLQGQNLI